MEYDASEPEGLSLDVIFALSKSDNEIRKLPQAFRDGLSKYRALKTPNGYAVLTDQLSADDLVKMGVEHFGLNEDGAPTTGKTACVVVQ